jgi:hypothetical protein
MKAIMRFVLVFLLCLSFGMPTSWASTAGTQLQVVLKIGSNIMLVNGKSVTIEKPYLKNNTTMVPLRVITASYGANVSWESKTKTVTIKYGSKTIQLKIGNRQAYVNGKATLLAVAPEIKNNLTMVPIRFVAETLGTVVTYDAKTKSITLKGTVLAPVIPKMGDSYYGWTMNFPSGLVKQESSFNNDYLYFEDVNGDYALELYIDRENTQNLTYQQLLQRLVDSAEGDILAQSVVTLNGKMYARVVQVIEDGIINEMRAYIGNGFVYYLDFYTIHDISDQKWKTYTDFLNSFATSYNKADSTIKDLTNVKDGLRIYPDSNFGMSFKIPADWVMDQTEDDYLLLHKPDGSQYLYLHISSLEPGDTLENWFTKAKDKRLEEINPSYIEAKEPVNTTVAGTEAREWDVKWTEDGKNWSSIHEVYFVKGNYKFSFVIQAEDEEVANLVKAIVPSITVDTGKINPSMGYIKDTTVYDKSKTVPYKSDSLNFSLSVPAYWEKADNSQADDLFFHFWGGYFGLSISEETLAEAEARVDLENEEAKQNNKTFEIEKENVLIAGAEAIQYRYTIINQEDVKQEMVEYLIHKDGKTYQMSYALLDANRTEKNLEILQKTIESFTFLQ